MLLEQLRIRIATIELRWDHLQEPNAYNSPMTLRDQTNTPPSTQSAQYGVSENPFGDDAAAQPPPTQNSYNLFSKPQTNTAMPPSQSAYQQPSQYNGGWSSSNRPPGPWAGTPSYVNRQESATNHLTMHGASPPSDSRTADLDPRHHANASDDFTGVQDRMDNLQV